MSDINVLRKLFENRGITFNSPLISAAVESISDYLLLAYWLNYFSHAEGVPKAIENTWKFVVIFLYLILRFASSSAHRSSCTHDRHILLFVLWIVWLSMQHCSEITKVRVENEWLRIRAKKINTKLIQLAWQR